MLSLTFALTYAGVAFTRPDYILTGKRYIEDSFYAKMFERDISVSGLRYLKKQRVRDLLPVHHSNIWWRLNGSSLTRELSKHPLVQSVAVRPCSFFSLTCFKLLIEERKAGMLATFSDGVWLLGTDGGYMVSVAETEDSPRVRKLRARRGLPLVHGLSDAASSPRMVRSRAMYVLRSRDELLKVFPDGVNSMRLHENGELTVLLNKYPFEIIFDASFDDPERLTVEVARLKALLIEMTGKERAIAKIDMAYDQSAVVTLTDEALAKQAEVNKKKMKG